MLFQNLGLEFFHGALEAPAPHGIFLDPICCDSPFTSDPRHGNNGIHLSSANAIEVCAPEVCVPEVCALEVCAIEVCALEVCALEVCAPEVCAPEVCVPEVCAIEVCAPEVCSLEAADLVVAGKHQELVQDESLAN